MKIGIDLGGTNIAIGLVDKKGKIIKKLSRRTASKGGYKAIVKQMASLVEKIKTDTEIKKVDTIGIGIPGVISKKGDVVRNCPNLGWEEKSLKKDLEALVHQPVFLANDATAAGIGESVHGALSGYKNAALFTIGTGVGGYLMVNGYVVHGKHGVDTEFGHLYVGDNFYDCNCGQNGCLETFSSATALRNYVNIQLESGRSSVITQKSAGKKITAKLIIDCAKTKDELCLEAFNRMVDKLGIAVNHLVNTVEPEIICFGGGVSMTGRYLINAIRKSANKRIAFPALGQPALVLATLRNDAGIIGASEIGSVVYKNR